MNPKSKLYGGIQIVVLILFGCSFFGAMITTDINVFLYFKWAAFILMVMNIGLVLFALIHEGKGNR